MFVIKFTIHVIDVQYLGHHGQIADDPAHARKFSTPADAQVWIDDYETKGGRFGPVMVAYGGGE